MPRLLMVLTLPLGLLAGTARADCPAAVTTADVRGDLDLAASAYRGLDVDAFVRAVDDASAKLPCLADPAPRSFAASYHRVLGLRAFIDRDVPTAEQAFAAARALEPAYRFPEELVPSGNPVLDAYLAVDVSALQSEPVAPPSVGRITFDGRDILERPTGVPTLVQLFTDEGAVSRTAYLHPRDPLPAYPSGGDGGRQAGPRKVNTPLLIVAGGGGAVAAAMFGGAAATRGRYMNPETPLSDLDGLRSTTNTLFVGSLIAGGLSVGTAGIAVFAGM